MLKEFGFDPEVPGLEVMETLIEEDLRYNPECPCPTRTCAQHGFCKYCIQHHADLRERFQNTSESSDEDSRGGEYPMDHFRPLCYRIPNEYNAGKRDDYK